MTDQPWLETSIMTKRGLAKGREWVLRNSQNAQDHNGRKRTHKYLRYRRTLHGRGASLRTFTRLSINFRLGSSDRRKYTLLPPRFVLGASGMGPNWTARCQ